MTDKDPTERFAEALVTWMVYYPLLFLFAIAEAYPVMLAMGVAHDHWPVIPALGFWALVLLIFGARTAKRILAK
jgi:hypothetical protein